MIHKMTISFAALALTALLFMPGVTHAQYYGGTQYGRYFNPSFNRPPIYQPQPIPQPYPYFPTQYQQPRNTLPSYIPNYFRYQSYQPYYQPRYNQPYYPPTQPSYPQPNQPSSLVANCSATTVPVQQPVVWVASASGGMTNTYTYAWGVYNDPVSLNNNGVPLNTRSISLTYMTPGVKQAAITISDGRTSALGTCSVTVTP